MNIFQKSHGFSLIEVLIAMLISSALMLSLYQMYKQVQRAVISINNVIDIDTPFTSMYDRFEIDFMGTIVPSSYTIDVKKLLDKEKKDEDKKTANTDTAKSDTKDQLAKEEGKKLSDIFVYTGSDNNFKLTFLTTGGIQSIDTTSDDGMARPALKPHIKRVFYTLEPDKNNPELFSLMWGQTDNLETTLADISKINKYELAWFIKQLNMTFFVYEVSKDGEAKDKPALVTLSSFDSKDTFEKYKTYVPAFITIKGIMVDQRDVRNQEFTFEFQIPSYVIPQKEKKDAEAEKPKEAKKEPEGEKISPNIPPKPISPTAKPNVKVAQNNKNLFVKM